MNWAIFVSEFSNFLIDVSSWKSMSIPIVCASPLPFVLHITHSIRSCVSNQDDLINLFLFVERLEEYLQCLVAPSSFWPNSLQERLQVDRSIFESCALKYLFFWTIVVPVDHDLDFNCCLDLLFIKDLVCLGKGVTNNLASSLECSWHWPCCVQP